jgi:hypothetical protein
MSHHDIQKLERLATWMDSRFTIPGTSIRFGLDSVLGLIPGIGDSASLITTAYIMSKAKEHKAPKNLRLKMLWNAFVDWLIGLIPLIGDLFDIGWKANHRNVALLKKHLEDEGKNI